MANNPSDPFENQLDKLSTLFEQDLLSDLERARWPDRVDYVAGRVGKSSYPVGMTSNDQRYLSSGSDLDKAARDHYLNGLATLVDRHSLQANLPDEFDIGTFLVEFARLRDGLERAEAELPPGEVLGRLLTRDLKRQYSGRKAQLAQRLPADVQTPHELVTELSQAPELAEQVQNALPDTTDPNSLTDRLGEVNLTTELWEHQLEALALWLYHGMNAYVDMATATGKTVLGLAAIAHAVDTGSEGGSSLGSLHPADQTRLQGIFEGEVPRPNPRRPRNVLIVTTDDLLGVQWARLFQEHCQTPPEYTKIEGQTITLPKMEIDIRSAASLEDVDPEDYRVAIFDEVHNYRSDGEWGASLRTFIDSRCPVLALTGSVTREFQRLVESVEAEFPIVYRYTHKQALADGVIPDFEWTLTFTSVQEETEVLDRVRTTAQYTKTRTQHTTPTLRFNESTLAETDPSLSESQRQNLAGTYETGSRVAAKLRNIGDEETEEAPTSELETLAHGLANRSLDRLNLRAQLDQVKELAEDALENERPVLILTRSYPEAETLWNKLYERKSERVVRRLEQKQTAETQDSIIEKFDEEDTDRKVLIGPGERIGQGNDIHSVEVGINLSRPGSGVNAALVQRLGRLLRNAGGKTSVEFYHILGVPPENAIIGPDGESFVRTVAEFFAQVLEPDTDGILKPPRVVIDDDVKPPVIALEQTGAPTVKRAEQATVVEEAYVDAIQTAKNESRSKPVVETDWFTRAFDIEYQSPTQNGSSEKSGSHQDNPEDGQLEETDAETTDTGTTMKQDTSQTTESVTVDRGMAALVQVITTSEGIDYDTTEALVEAALTSFLKSTIGTDIDPESFTLSGDSSLDLSCDPVTDQIIEASIATDERYETREDFLEAALYDMLGISDVDEKLTVPEYERYELNVEAIIENDDYPCETPGEVVQVALESFFDIS
jgi:superfamily II DNA or RNA helicase